MKKNLVVLNQIGVYALVKWNGQYVVAWNYDSNTTSWDQGHYFDNELVAEQVFRDKVKAYYG